VSLGNRAHDQCSLLTATLFAPMRAEQVKEAELEEASQRREAVLSALASAHAALQRRRRALTTLRAKGGDAGKVAAAEAAVGRAERRFEQRQRAVAEVTEGIKREMLRVMRERRVATAAHLLDFVRKQVGHARARAGVWRGVAGALAIDAADADASLARVLDLEREVKRVTASDAGGAGAAAGAGASP
jgi:hypothetical protein